MTGVSNQIASFIDFLTARVVTLLYDIFIGKDEKFM